MSKTTKPKPLSRAQQIAIAKNIKRRRLRRIAAKANA
jgi:hypothetical protein